MRLLALDTETNGADFNHGTKPFYVSTCDETGLQHAWRWRVDPYTRKVSILPEDLEEIQSLIERADIIVGQNLKWDVHALRHAGMRKSFPWHKVRDTLIAGHILASSQPHDLTSMVLDYLGEDIKPFEDSLAEAVQEARRIAGLKWFQEQHGVLAIAKKDRADMPSAGESPWRMDYWLPFEMAELLKYDAGHPWRTVLEEYANPDPVYALALWKVMEPEIKRRGGGGWNRFMENMEIARITCEMETHGITRSKSRSAALYKEFKQEETRHANVCLAVAKRHGYPLELPKGTGINNKLREFIFDVLELPVVGWTDGGKKGEPQPSLDKDAMLAWILTTEGDQYEFIRALYDKRAYSSAVASHESYDRYSVQDPNDPDLLRLHPNINPVGTGTTRTSSDNPNGQNAGKGRELDEGRSVPSIRKELGPAKGRVWFSLDYENLELMIPAYFTGEEAMIELFEHPDKGPYFGSWHLLSASIIYDDLFWPIADIKGEFKRRYASTWYKSLKNFNFGVQYDAGDVTADAAAKRKGSKAKLMAGLPKIAAKKAETLAYARKHGLVRTLPDLTVPGDEGYPLMVGRYQDGKVKATTPWNYVIQGTAGWAKKKAMIRCDRKLKEWFKQDKFSGRMVLDVHDELVFDFPAGHRLNRDRIAIIKQEMEKSGTDIGIPLRVSVSYHPVSWGEEEKF